MLRRRAPVGGPHRLRRRRASLRGAVVSAALRAHREDAGHNRRRSDRPSFVRYAGGCVMDEANAALRQVREWGR